MASSLEQVFFDHATITSVEASKAHIPPLPLYRPWNFYSLGNVFAISLAFTTVRKQPGNSLLKGHV